MISFFLLDELSLEGEVLDLHYLEGEGSRSGGDGDEACAAFPYQDRAILDLFGLVDGVAYDEHPFGRDGFEGEPTVGTVEEMECGWGTINRTLERHHPLGVVGEVRVGVVKRLFRCFDGHD